MLSEIWRYPVKSCGGESLGEVDVGPSGLVGDRAWAVVDAATGLVASAKRPSHWESLLSVGASIADGHVSLQFPSGETCSLADSAALTAQLSSFIGRSVALQLADEIASPTLERTDPEVDSLFSDGALALSEVATGPLGTAAPPGTVFDFAPIHLISTATLQAVEAAGGTAAGDARRFRPNLVLDIDGPAFQENDWPGQRLTLGSSVVLDVIMQSPRCVVPSLPQTGLPRSVSTLRSLASINRIEIDGRGVFSCAGAYATVVQPGSAVVGAAVTVGPSVA